MSRRRRRDPAGSSGPVFIAGAHSSALGTVPKPAGAAVGDLLIIIASHNPSNAFVTPTGFTAVPNTTLTNAAIKSQSWYRVVDGSEAGSFTWSNAAAGGLGAVCLLYRGVGATPISSSSGTANGGGAQDATCPSLTGPGIFIAAGVFQNLTNTIPTPATFTKEIENVGNYKAVAFDKTAGAGATGTVTITGPEWGAGISIMLAMS